jgi:hypothetical protein
MKSFPMTLAALGAFCALAACESAGGQYDGVSRFAGAYGPYLILEAHRGRRRQMRLQDPPKRRAISEL